MIHTTGYCQVVPNSARPLEDDVKKLAYFHWMNMVPGVFTHTYGDLHIYSNHTEQIKEQLGRLPKCLPKLHLNEKIKSLFDFRYEVDT
jgi:hypothetical protein